MAYYEKKTKNELVEGVRKPFTGLKIIACATLDIKYSDGTRAIRYHNTDVVTWNNDGTVTLNSGGWRTPTTKKRIIEHTRLRLFQANGEWRVNGKFFYDGITFRDNELVSEDREPDAAKIKKTKKLISAYVAEIDKLEKLPLPNNGDCWYCLIRDQNGTPWGDNGNYMHLHSHLEEKYIHGSILLSALKEKGYSHPTTILQMNCKDHAKRAVRKYFMKRLLPELASV